MEVISLKEPMIVLEEKELEAIICALLEGRDRAVRAHSGNYCQLAIYELYTLIADLENHKKGRGV